MIAPRHRSPTASHRRRRKQLQILVLSVAAALVLGLGFFLGHRAAQRSIREEEQMPRRVPACPVAGKIPPG